jgi:hypothetical protein
MVMDVKRDLGFDLSPRFIVVGAIWALTIHSAQDLITRCTKGTG